MEIINRVFKDNLDMKKEITISAVEIREVPRSLSKDHAVALTFLNKYDRESVLNNTEALENNGIKVGLMQWRAAALCCTTANTFSDHQKYFLFKVTEELDTDRMLNWYKLNKIEEKIKLKYPSIGTTLSVDKLLIEDKIISWDQNKKKLSSRTAYTLPRREKNRFDDEL